VRHPRLLAVAVSAVVGVACGVAGGLLIGHQGPIVDPLNVGAPLVNQTCNGQSLLMLRWGGSSSPVGAGIAKDPSHHARYLDTTASCPTAWALAGHSAPRYVAYLGPYSAVQACQLRMTKHYRGTRVTTLTAGNADPVMCACRLPTAGMPQLRTGMGPSAFASIWIRALQRELIDLGVLRAGHPNGVYDPVTVAAVKRFQSEHSLPPKGVVDSTTWDSLQNKACILYDS